MSDNTLLRDDWHPVAFSHLLEPGRLLPVRLLDEELVLWRHSDGSVHLWDDRCPHRGARLSLGEVRNDRLACPYHGWRFDGDGVCVLRPAQPTAPLPKTPLTTVFHAQERYGIIWACIGSPAQDIVPYAEFEDPGLRNVMAGPYAVNACAPRVVENFIDMAHFSFVHRGLLGEEDSTEVPAYDVEDFVDATGQSGVQARGMRVSQPRANLQATGPSDVVYGYRISRPLSAILTKHIVASGVTEAIALFIQPMTEEESQAWMIFSAQRSAEPDAAVRAFQDTIFAQDRPILESQRPKRLPLQVRAELAQRADLLSAHYRRFLREKGLAYGVIAE